MSGTPDNSQTISIDELMMTLFDCIDDFIDNTIKNIVTKGFLLNENEFEEIIPSKINKYQEEVDSILNKIDEYFNPPSGQPGILPDLSQTDEIIFFINEQIPMVLRWMSRVVESRSEREYSLIHDDHDKENMHNACVAFKNSVDRLRTIISGIGGNYDIPIEFEFTQ